VESPAPKIMKPNPKGNAQGDTLEHPLPASMIPSTESSQVIDGHSILSRSTAVAGRVEVRPPLTYRQLEKVCENAGLPDMVALGERLGYKMESITTTSTGDRTHSTVRKWQAGQIPSTMKDRIESEFGKNAIDWDLSPAPKPVPNQASAESKAGFLHGFGNEALNKVFGTQGYSTSSTYGSSSSSSMPSSSANPPRKLTLRHLEDLCEKKNFSELIDLYEDLGYNMNSVKVSVKEGVRTHSTVREWQAGKISTTVMRKIEEKYGKDAIDWTLASTPSAITREEQIAIGRMQLPELYSSLRRTDGTANVHHMKRIIALTGHNFGSFAKDVIGKPNAKIGSMVSGGGPINDKYRTKILDFLDLKHADEVTPGSAPATSSSHPE
jgi:hypothetical protein